MLTIGTQDFVSKGTGDDLQSLKKQHDTYLSKAYFLAIPHLFEVPEEWLVTFLARVTIQPFWCLRKEGVGWGWKSLNSVVYGPQIDTKSIHLRWCAAPLFTGTGIANYFEILHYVNQQFLYTFAYIVHFRSKVDSHEFQIMDSQSNVWGFP